MRSLLPTEPVTQPSRRRQARFVPHLSDDPDTRAVQIGIAATLLVHLMLFVVVPDQLENDLQGSFTPEQLAVQNQTFSIEMAPDEFLDIKPPAKPDPLKYVEANPDAPDNEPDKTNNFSFMNQQAAQEQAAKKTGGDRPEMEGRKDMESNQIVSGNLSETKPFEAVPPPSPEVAEAQKSVQQQREQNPLPGLEKQLGDSPDGIGSNIAKIAPHPEDVPEHVEGTRDAPLNEGVVGRQSSAQRQVPKERPKLDRRARPAIFSENNLGTANIGAAGIDARWSNYGAYLHRLMEAVQMRWDALIEASHSYPTHGSVVKVKFILNKQGEVEKVVSVDGGVANQLAESWCVAAITKPAPYGKWSDDMIAILGEQQELTFAFYYQ